MEKCPIIFFGPKLCQACNKQGIEIYDRFDNPLGYSSLLRDKNSTGLYRVTVENMKRDVVGTIEVEATTKTENVVVNVKKKSE